MAASLRQQGDRFVLEGVVDFDNAAAIHASGLALVSKAGPAIVVDLSGVLSENSITVAVVVQWLRAAAAAGKRLSVEGAPPQFSAIVGVSGLGAILTSAS